MSVQFGAGTTHEISTLEANIESCTPQQYHAVCGRVRRERPEATPTDTFSARTLSTMDLLMTPSLADKPTQKNLRSAILGLAKSKWELSPSRLVFYFGLDVLTADSFLRVLRNSAKLPVDFDTAYSAISQQYALRRRAPTKGVSDSSKWMPSDCTRAMQSLNLPRENESASETGGSDEEDYGDSAPTTPKSGPFTNVQIERGTTGIPSPLHPDSSIPDIPAPSVDQGPVNASASVRNNMRQQKPYAGNSRLSTVHEESFSEARREPPAAEMVGDDDGGAHSTWLDTYDSDGGESNDNATKGTPMRQQDRSSKRNVVEENEMAALQVQPEPGMLDTTIEQEFDDTADSIEVARGSGYQKLFGSSKKRRTGEGASRDKKRRTNSSSSGAAQLGLVSPHRVSRSNRDGSYEMRPDDGDADDGVHAKGLSLDVSLSDFEIPPIISSPAPGPKSIEPSTYGHARRPSQGSRNPEPPNAHISFAPLVNPASANQATAKHHLQPVAPLGSTTSKSMLTSDHRTTAAGAMHSLEPDRWLSGEAIHIALDLMLPPSFHVVDCANTRTKSDLYRPFKTHSPENLPPFVLPISINDTHWTLALFQPAKLVCRIFDSWKTEEYREDSVKLANGFLDKVPRKGPWQVVHVEKVLKQSDMFNCGLFAILNALFYATCVLIPEGLDDKFARHVLSYAIHCQYPDQTAAPVKPTTTFPLIPPGPDLSVMRDIEERQRAHVEEARLIQEYKDALLKYTKDLAISTTTLEKLDSVMSYTLGEIKKLVPMQQHLQALADVTPAGFAMISFTGVRDVPRQLAQLGTHISKIHVLERVMAYTRNLREELMEALR